MVDKDSLEDSSIVGVTAAIMSLSSLITLYMLIKNATSYNYPQAQRLLFLIFLMPVLIGWSAWTEILTHARPRVLEFLANIFKAVCVACFFTYLTRMLGIIYTAKGAFFSEYQIYNVLTSAQGEWRLIGCITVPSLSTPEKAKRYFNWITILVYQAVAITLLIGVIGGVIVLDSGLEALNNGDFELEINMLTGLKSISTFTAVIALLNFGLYTERIPGMMRFGLFHKLIIIKLGIMCTDVQPLVVYLFAERGLIVNNGEFSQEEVTTYTNALLLVIEMAMVVCLMSYSFPMEDYERGKEEEDESVKLKEDERHVEYKEIDSD
jgi:hypothetical protein